MVDREVALHRVAYISRGRVALSDLELDQLATRAAAANAEYGVTGLLLYDGRRFIQALEGDQQGVETIMARIVGDARHDSIEYMAQGPADRREFGSWSMSCKRVGSDCCTREFLTDVKNQVQSLDDVFLQAAFIGFALLGSDSPNPRYSCSKPAV